MFRKHHHSHRNHNLLLLQQNNRFNYLLPYLPSRLPTLNHQLHMLAVVNGVAILDPRVQIEMVKRVQAICAQETHVLVVATTVDYISNARLFLLLQTILIVKTILIVTGTKPMVSINMILFQQTLVTIPTKADILWWHQRRLQ